MSRQAEQQEPVEYVRAPLAALAACFALGIALARNQPAGPPGASLLLACGLCLLLGLLALRRGLARVSFLLALTGFVGAGATATELFEFRFPPHHMSRLSALGIDPSAPLVLEGRIVSTPYRTGYGVQFDVDAERVEATGQQQSVTGRVRLHVQPAEETDVAAGSGALRLHYGDTIRGVVRLRRPRIYQNPGSFNFRRWMESIEDVYWVGTVKSLARIEPSSTSRVYKVAELPESARRHLLEGIDRLYPPWSAEGPNGAVLKAALLGDRTALNSDTIENFRKVGLYHLLVIAGLHVGLLAMLAALFLRLLRVRESWRSVWVLMFLLAYASLVEQRASTLRATLMITVYLLARIFYREHTTLNAIGLAALMLLIRRPAWLFESGFQLSFSAALLIVALVVPILERVTEPYRAALAQIQDVDLDLTLTPRQAQFRLDLRTLMEFLKKLLPILEKHPALNAALITVPMRAVLWTINILLFSAILQLGLLLPMAETFHRVSFAGIALNALAIPVMTVLLAVALPTVIASTLAPALAPGLGKVLGLAMSALFALTNLPNLPPALSYRIPGPPGWVTWGFGLSAVAVAWALSRRHRAVWAGLGALGIFAALISLHPFAPRLPRGVLEVTALDCGGGDALFAALPDGTTLLVDACGSRARSVHEGTLQGRRWDPGEDIVSAYLWTRGVRKLDIVAATGARPDHWAGLAAVVRNFRVGEFWYGSTVSMPDSLAFIEEVRRRGVAVRQVKAGDLIGRSGTSIQILWPPPFLGEGSMLHPASQDDALVLRIADGAATVLVPGDISSRVEEALAQATLPLESQVLRVAHHGARSVSSPDFLRRVSPRLVLVTGESANPMNSSNPETLRRLQAEGAMILRTELAGAVSVEMKGGTFTVRSYRPSGGEGAGVSAVTSTFSVP